MPAIKRFKVGDRVRVVPGFDIAGVLEIGVGGVVVRHERPDAPGGKWLIDVQCDDGEIYDGWFEERFELVAPAAAPVQFKVGDRVTLIEAPKRKGVLVLGVSYMVEEVKPMFGMDYIKLNGLWFSASRFKQVFFAVGDEVKVVRKVEWNDKGHFCGWDKKMAVGVVGKITQIRRDRDRVNPGKGDIFKIGNWWYLEDCLAYPDEAVVPEEQQPKQKKPDVVVDVRARLRDALNLKDRRQFGIASYALGFNNGFVRFQENDVCHARIVWGGRYTDEGEHQDLRLTCLALSLHCHKHHLGGNKEDIASYREYTDYMLNRSPWADCFITKDLDEAFDEGVLMNVEKPINQIAGACIALREGVEFPNKLHLFSLLLKKGYSGNVAYLLSYAFDPREKDRFSIANMGGGHTVLYRGMPAEGLFTFFRNGYVPQWNDKPYREYGQNYRVFGAIVPGYDMYGRGPKEDDFGKFIGSNVKKKVVGEGFQKNEFITEESILELADKLEIILKQEKEAA